MITDARGRARIGFRLGPGVPVRIMSTPFVLIPPVRPFTGTGLSLVIQHGRVRRAGADRVRRDTSSRTGHSPAPAMPAAMQRHSNRLGWGEYRVRLEQLKTLERPGVQSDAGPIRATRLSASKISSSQASTCSMDPRRSASPSHAACQHPDPVTIRTKTGVESPVARAVHGARVLKSHRQGGDGARLAPSVQGRKVPGQLACQPRRPASGAPVGERASRSHERRPLEDEERREPRSGPTRFSEPQPGVTEGGSQRGRMARTAMA